MSDGNIMRRRDAEGCGKMAAVYERLRSYAECLAMRSSRVDTVAHYAGETRICLDDGSVVTVLNR